ncbi:MAG: hypothetical protein ABUK01_08860 [Leptospirales bacterium]
MRLTSLQTLYKTCTWSLLIFLAPVMQSTPHAILEENAIIIHRIDNNEQWRSVNTYFKGGATNDKIAIAIGLSGEIFITKNAYTWYQQKSPTSQVLSGAACNREKCVIVGSNGTILSGEEGKNWKIEKSGTKNHLYSVTWTGSMFVATGWESILYSTNGSQWSKSKTNFNGAKNIFKVAGSKKKIVALAACGSIWTSSDAIHWIHKKGKCDLNSYLYDIIWDGSRFIIVGASGIVMRSKDGEIWENQDFSGKTALRFIIKSKKSYFIKTTKNTWLYSKDAKNWEARTYPEIAKINRFISFRDKIIGLGYGNGIHVLEEATNHWHYTHKSPPMLLTDIRWYKGKYIGIGPNPGIYTSKKGVHWDRQRFPIMSDIRDVTSNGKNFIAVGDNGVLAVSHDGKQWGNVKDFSSKRFVRVKWVGTQYVALKSNGEVMVSPNGQRWQNITRNYITTAYGKSTNVTTEMNSVATDGKIFVVVGNGGNINLMLAGNSWTKLKLQYKENLYDVTWCNNRFVTTGENGLLLSSSNGAMWKKLATNFGHTLHRISCYKNNIIGLKETGELLFLNLDTGDVKLKTFASAVIDYFTGENVLTVLTKDNTIYESHYNKTWQKEKIRADAELLSIASSKSIKIVVGKKGAVFSSTESKHWVQQYIEKFYNLAKIVQVGDGLVMMGNYGALYYSPDGKAWESMVAPNANYFLLDILWTGSEYILTAVQGIMYNSKDGMVWETIDKFLYYGYPMFSMAKNDSVLVGVGFNGRTFLSMDGHKWKMQLTGAKHLYDVEWCSDRFIAVGHGMILTSSNGKKWKKYNSIPGIFSYELEKTLIKQVKCHGTVAMVVGAGGFIAISTDSGETWKAMNSPTTLNLNSIETDGERFIIGGDYYNIFLSPHMKYLQKAEIEF